MTRSSVTPFELQSPNDVVFGRGTAAETGARAGRFGDVALLVTDSNLRKLGVVDPVTTALEERDLDVELFDEVEPDPALSVVEACVDAARRVGADVLVGVGGGSSMDVAKGASVFLTNDELADDPFGRNHLSAPGAPTILLPTTAGSGAEVSPAVVLADDRGPGSAEKRGIVDSNVFADVAIVDPNLSLSLPRDVTRATGVDAFAHAVGSYVSTASNPLADALCGEAMRLVEANLRDATFRGADAPAARERMALAATTAMLGRVNGGKSAIHSVAYGVQAKYGVSHGRAIAMVLPEVLEFNLPGCVEELAALGGLLYDARGGPRERAEAFVDGVYRLRSDLGMDASLSSVGGTEEDLAELAELAVQSKRHLEANPRPLDTERARCILAGIL